MIREQWYSTNVVGSTMFRVSKKFQTIKHCIREFSRDNYLNLEKRVAEGHELVLQSQSLTLADPSVSNATQELEHQRKWLILVQAEERYFCQNSSVSWLRDGDSNTAYFHRMADSRKIINSIAFLIDENEIKFKNQEGIKDYCINYFGKLLGGDQGPLMLEHDDMNILLLYRCSQVYITELEIGFTNMEIEAAFFSLPRNKSSGPNGYSA